VKLTRQASIRGRRAGGGQRKADKELIKQYRYIRGISPPARGASWMSRAIPTPSATCRARWAKRRWSNTGNGC